MTAFTPLPLQPHDDDGPVFAEPWQAQAFALTVKLHEQGHFSWPEWAETLGAEIQAAVDAGEPAMGDTYYDHWMRALEKLALEKGLATSATIDQRADQWRQAYLNTPHGQPVRLSSAN